MKYRFAEFEFDASTSELTMSGKSVDLQTQPSRLLSMLVRNPGRIVTREDIQSALWPVGTHVDFDGGINFCVRQLRKALHDSATDPRFVQTLPRKGYRFVAPVTIVKEARRRTIPLRFAAALALGVGLGASATPCVHDRAVEHFHRFFGINRESCAIHRMLA